MKLLPFILLLAVGCAKKEDYSKVDVIAGEVAARSESPWAVPILLEVNGASEAHCTGTIVSPDRVLTAAHCIVGSVSFWYRGERLKPQSTVVHPGFSDATDLHSKKMHDVAVMKFDRDYFYIDHLALASSHPGFAQEITFYGYGHVSYSNTVNIWVFLGESENGEAVDLNRDGKISYEDLVAKYILNPTSTEGDGRLRYGHNRIESINDSLMIARGAISNSLDAASSAAPGDSGGPVLSESTGELVGLVQGGALINDDIELDSCRLISTIGKRAFSGIFPDKKPSHKAYKWYYCPNIHVSEKESYFLDLTSKGILEFIDSNLGR